MRPAFVQFEVSKARAGQRLEHVLVDAAGMTPDVVQGLLEAGAVFVNGKRSRSGGRVLRVGDRVRAPRSLPPVPRVDLTRRVIYRDPEILVVDKPAGVASAPTRQGARGTLPALLQEQLGLPEAPVVVHRLDRDVSGVLALALSRAGARRLTAAFERGEARKWYRGLVHGAPPETTGRIEAPIGRDPQRPGRTRVDPRGDAARTDYEVLVPASEHQAHSELCLRLHTGRTHQIRVHLSHLGCPLLGDRWYGGPGFTRIEGQRQTVKRLCLHAERLELPWGAPGTSPDDEAPVSCFEAPVPAFLDPR